MSSRPDNLRVMCVLCVCAKISYVRRGLFAHFFFMYSPYLSAVTGGGGCCLQKLVLLVYRSRLRGHRDTLALIQD